MNTKQELHLANLKEKVIERLGVKYRAGAKEHGGTLADMSALQLNEEIISEAIDSLVYALTQREVLLKK